MQPNELKLESFLDEFDCIEGLNVIGSSALHTLTVAELFDLVGESISLYDMNLDYKSTKNLEAIVAASYNDTNISSDNILITRSASEAIFLTVGTLLRPGDEVLVCFPAYQSLYEIARITGANVSFYNYFENDGYKPDLNAVFDALHRRPPKALILNTPHNPTGHVIDEASLKRLLLEANLHGTTVIVDEVFSGIWLGSTQPVSSGIVLNPHTIVVDSLSKIYGLSGLGMGWVAGPQEFIRDCNRWRHYISSPLPPITQKISEIAIRNRNVLLDRAQQIAGRNYACATKWLKNNRKLLDWVEPYGGLTMLIRFKLPINTEQFARELAEHIKVLLIPCTYCFDMPEGYFRLGLGGDPTAFERGLDKITLYIQSLSW